MSQSNPLLIFDLDGTLVDSVRDLVPALNKAISLEGVPPLTRDDVGHVVGQGALKMIELAFKLHGHRLEVGGVVHKHLLDAFITNYEANTANETIFFEGVLTALNQLSKDGWKFAVCTNKYERLARKLLTGLGELDRFAAVTGGDTFEFKKPDARHLFETVKLADGDISRCVMVGDSINDIAAAQAAQLPVIAVDFGYTDVPVEELNPDVIISHFDELTASVSKLVELK